MPRYTPTARTAHATHDRLGDPGTPGGTCLEDCEHLYCAMTRAESAAICAKCRGPIGYGRGFDRDGGRVAHAACAGEKPVTMYHKKGPWRKRVMGVLVEVEPDGAPLDDE